MACLFCLTPQTRNELEKSCSSLRRLKGDFISYEEKMKVMRRETAIAPKA